MKVRQTGAALLVAMLTVVLVASLASAAMWQHWRGVAQESVWRQQQQAAWLLVGALDWARLILRQDALDNSSRETDHLAEPWALALQEFKLSDFLSQQKKSAAGMVTVATDASDEDGAEQVFLSGQIADLQGRFNLRNLNHPDPAAAATARQTWQRLFAALGLDANLASSSATQLRQGFALQFAQLATAWGSTNSAQPLPISSVLQLEQMGLPTAAVRTLLPFVTLLPVVTPLNANTASAPVLAAYLGLTLPQAQALVERRKTGHWSNIEAVKAAARALGGVSGVVVGTGGKGAGSGAGAGGAPSLAVRSDYFEIKGRIRYVDNALEERSIVRRDGVQIQVLSRERAVVLP